ncbi:thioesterase family protein [Streptomonospora nanhaiensis]|uniref:Putative thioesterase n=1 Tax=Streptomonospora nanhaiensis TaxID=1323731 RepID=A0A853BTX1_9ACTN|nr:hotdog domain-containing protein [Streptomonospora nanhaiensis]MBV2362694.1 thioesterase [Streptomonospora nanhaiensis]MBX9389152.1 thioesterase [Streptomonospora nanhaiensis]NYI97957.1 putative thioesterase [Streptomonospora nanhaiensis]
MAITEGLRGAAELRVGAEDTAAALGSGDVDVLGTPRALALAEAATVAALTGRLAEGETTVGTEVALSHLAASPVGAVVRAEARLRLVDGRRLVFDVALAHPDGRAVARGTVERVVVNRARFTAGARA